MRIIKSLRKDQETILRFLDAFGGGAAALGASSKHAHPAYFLSASAFIHEYIEESFFKKEELLLKALENCGFPPEDGAIAAMRNEQEKSRKTAELLMQASKEWQAGDEGARVEVGWAASEYSTTLRQNLNRLKTLIFPLLEQNISPDEDQKVTEELGTVGTVKNETEQYNKLIEMLEEELSDWR